MFLGRVLARLCLAGMGGAGEVIFVLTGWRISGVEGIASAMLMRFQFGSQGYDFSFLAYH